MNLVSVISLVLACSTMAMSVALVPSPYCLCGTAYKLRLGDPADLINAIPRLVAPLPDKYDKYESGLASFKDRFMGTSAGCRTPTVCQPKYEYVRPACVERQEFLRPLPVPQTQVCSVQRPCGSSNCQSCSPNWY